MLDTLTQRQPVRRHRRRRAVAVSRPAAATGVALPLLVISPYSRQNAIDSGVTDQSSITRFIEDNWGLARVGGGSLDGSAGQLNGLFDFSSRHDRTLILNPSTGQPAERQGG